MTNNVNLFHGTARPVLDHIDAANSIIEIELRREHLQRLVGTPLAVELADENRMRAQKMIDELHGVALSINTIKDL